MRIYHSNCLRSIMDSHTDTADPWAATTEAPESEAQGPLGAESAAGDDSVEGGSASAEVADEAGSKAGLFGRRKSRERSPSHDEGGFDLITPAPHLLGEEPHFEVLESDTLTEAPELGLGDNFSPAEEVPFEPTLSMVEPLAEVAVRDEDVFDFETVSEEIANAVADAQPVGIFGALANPGIHFSPPEVQTTDKASEDLADDTPEEIIETVEEILEDTSEEAVENAVDDIVEEAVIEDLDSDELGSIDEADEPEAEANVFKEDDAEETHSGEEQQVQVAITDLEDEQAVSEDLSEDTSEADETVNEIDIPADPSEDTEEVNEITEQPDIEEPSMDQLTTTHESGFSLTNALAEPSEGEVDLFVSVSTEELIQDVVLVTTDTVPGMEMGDSCGLVTAVRAADEALSLPTAIDKAHADLANKAEEVGATAVISVTTDVTEVQAGYLVIASGTAVLAAS
jgi:uncharacterized protein YbjQ (UPF0145 family)